MCTGFTFGSFRRCRCLPCCLLVGLVFLSLMFEPGHFLRHTHLSLCPYLYSCCCFILFTRSCLMQTCARRGSLLRGKKLRCRNSSTATKAGATSQTLFCAWPLSRPLMLSLSSCAPFRHRLAEQYGRSQATLRDGAFRPCRASAPRFLLPLHSMSWPCLVILTRAWRAAGHVVSGPAWSHGPRSALHMPVWP